MQGDPGLNLARVISPMSFPSHPVSCPLSQNQFQEHFKNSSYTYVHTNQQKCSGSHLKIVWRICCSSVTQVEIPTWIYWLYFIPSLSLAVLLPLPLPTRAWNANNLPSSDITGHNWNIKEPVIRQLIWLMFTYGVYFSKCLTWGWFV